MHNTINHAIIVFYRIPISSNPYSRISYQKRVVHDISKHQKFRITFQLQTNAISSIRLDLKLRGKIAVFQYHIRSVQALHMSGALVLFVAHHILMPTEPTSSLLAKNWRRKVPRNPRSLNVVPKIFASFKLIIKRKVDVIYVR